MADLKPCPFCGVVPHFKHLSNIMRDTSKSVEFAVYCQGCGIQFPGKFTFEIAFELESESGIKVICDERDKAAEAWNRRADNG
jgi:triosephosphate isomerase